MLFGVLITYNDMPLVRRCVESMLDHVDALVVVDGIFADFPHEPHEPGYSTDGTLEYLAGLDKETMILVKPDLSEVEKRSCYLVGEEGDYYLHLDADEHLENPELLAEIPDADVLFCPLFRPDGVTHFYPRVFRHQKGLRYRGLHHRLVDGSGRFYADIHGCGAGVSHERWGLRICHDRESRPPERKKRKLKYYSILTAREREYRELLRYG